MPSGSANSSCAATTCVQASAAPTIPAEKVRIVTLPFELIRYAAPRRPRSPYDVRFGPQISTRTEVNNHRLEGGGFKGCQLEIDCRREEARHPGSLCTPLPSRPLCFLNSPPDILGPRSAGPKTSSSGEQTPEGVLGSLFLLATARSYSGPGVVGRIRTRGRGRVQPYPRLCAAHVPSRSDESDRAHEPLLDRSKPFYDISVSKRCALLGPFSCALRACSDARDHNTTIFSSPKGEGFRPSPEETLRSRDRPELSRVKKENLDRGDPLETTNRTLMQLPPGSAILANSKPRLNLGKHV